MLLHKPNSLIAYLIGIGFVSVNNNLLSFEISLLISFAAVKSLFIKLLNKSEHFSGIKFDVTDINPEPPSSSIERFSESSPESIIKLGSQDVFIFLTILIIKFNLRKNLT